MKYIKILLPMVICIIAYRSFAQQNEQCLQCNMKVADNLHRAIAKKGDKVSHFGSIECLVNYLKNKDEKQYTSLRVSDYDSGEMIMAKDAYYLISQAIKSPMGANLSAFKTKDAAMAQSALDEDRILNWTELNTLFKDSKVLERQEFMITMTITGRMHMPQSG